MEEIAGILVDTDLSELKDLLIEHFVIDLASAYHSCSIVSDDGIFPNHQRDLEERARRLFDNVYKLNPEDDESSEEEAIDNEFDDEGQKDLRLPENCITVQKQNVIYDHVSSTRRMLNHEQEVVHHRPANEDTA
ncbi:hypothetical protein CHS0354_030298 [Potamilus streckersoni]|uniref:Uncharacterized protein n=1 Tax=Potamilus streckersoni TaxID=2493646 RepID=A0AAE0T565_9BIVA|nr:hypothetical protein CHS0354_030298 [Potamilus streckersoni]